MRLLKDAATFETLETWISHNAMRYQTRYRIFSLRFAWFWAICNALPPVTINCFKRILIYIFISLTVTRANPLQIAPNYTKLRENVR